MSKGSIPKSERSFCGSELGLVLFAESNQDLGIFPLRQNGLDICVQVQQTLFNALHDRDACDELGCGCNPVYIISSGNFSWVTTEAFCVV